MERPNRIRLQEGLSDFWDVLGIFHRCFCLSLTYNTNSVGSNFFNTEKSDRAHNAICLNRKFCCGAAAKITFFSPKRSVQNFSDRCPPTAEKKVCFFRWSILLRKKTGTLVFLPAVSSCIFWFLCSRGRDFIFLPFARSPQFLFALAVCI